MRSENVSINVAGRIGQGSLVSFAVALGNVNAATDTGRTSEGYGYAVR
jgi:dUTPase